MVTANPCKIERRGPIPRASTTFIAAGSMKQDISGHPARVGLSPLILLVANSGTVSLETEKICDKLYARNHQAWVLHLPQSQGR